MFFASPSIGIQFGSLHPEVRRVLSELNTQLLEWNLAPVTITCILRTLDEQEHIYWPSLLAECGTEEEARKAARHKFSWHLLNKAADIRTVSYPDDDVDRIMAWLRERCPPEDWELLLHDIGHGRHIHIAKRRGKNPEPV